MCLPISDNDASERIINQILKSDSKQTEYMAMGIWGNDRTG